jgi:hypothetical protein
MFAAMPAGPPSRANGADLDGDPAFARSSSAVRKDGAGGWLIDTKTVSEARSVSYRRQPAELFQVAPDYAPAPAPEGAPGP